MLIRSTSKKFLSKYPPCLVATVLSWCGLLFEGRLTFPPLPF